MNTPTIAAALSSPSPQAGRAAGNSSDAESGASFSHVLGDQQAAIGQQVRTETHPAAGGATGQTVKGKAEPSAKNKAGAEDAPSDAALSELAGEQGLSLPQIALSLAAHALAGTAQGPAQPSEDSDLAAQAPTQALQRGKADLATLLAKAAPAQGDTPAKADPQAVGGETALSARFSVAGAGERQFAPANPALTEAAAPGARTATKLVRAPAAGAQAVDKPASQAAQQVPTSTQNALGAIAAANTAAALPDSISSTPLSTAPTYDISALAGAAPQAQNAGNAMFAGASLGVSAPLQSPQWPSDFGRQFVMLSQNAGNQPQTAELRLDPPELGPIRITININDNVAHAVFVSAHASVRSAIENALPQLQQQLAQAGISLGQANVSDQGQQQSAFQQSFQASGQHTGRSTSAGAANGLESAVAQAGARATQNPNSLVDTFA